MTFTEGQISTIRTDGIRIAIQIIQEKTERSVPQLDQNFIFPNSSLKLAEMRAMGADWGKVLVPGIRATLAAGTPPSLPASTLPLL